MMKTSGRERYTEIAKQAGLEAMGRIGCVGTPEPKMTPETRDS